MNHAQNNTILYIKLSNLAIAAEQLANKKLAGKAIVISDGAKNRTVFACSKPAAVAGITTGMLLADARQLCPSAVFITGSTEKYARFSDKVGEWLFNSTPLLEKTAADQYYCRLPDSFCGDPLRWATILKQNLEKEFGLTVTIGCGATKLIALLAAGLNAGSANFLPDNCAQKELDLQPVSMLPFVTENTTQLLAGKGIRKVGVLRRLPKDLLVSLTGKETGNKIWDFAHCHDTRLVVANLQTTSVTTQIKFSKPVASQTEIRSVLKQISHDLSTELVKNKKLCGFINLRIEYADCRYAFKKVFVSYTNLGSQIATQVLSAYAKISDRNQKVVAVTLYAGDVINSGYQQLSLFAPEEKIKKHLPYSTFKNRIGLPQPAIYSGIFADQTARVQICR